MTSNTLPQDMVIPQHLTHLQKGSPVVIDLGPWQDYFHKAKGLIEATFVQWYCYPPQTHFLCAEYMYNGQLHGTHHSNINTKQYATGCCPCEFCNKPITVVHSPKQ